MSHEHEHWQAVYQSRGEQQTSWFRPHLDEPLRLIDGLDLARDTPIIDVGAGRSTLVDDLLARGFGDISVLDLSDAALQDTRARVGDNLAVRWLTTDILGANLPVGHYGLWHDRAAFHFLTWPEHRERYLAQAARSIGAGGYLILSTFAIDGPEKCSGLPVCRYDAASLAAVFAGAFEAVADSRETHNTPFATEQPFTCLLLRRTIADAATDSNQSHLRAGHATD